METLLHETYWCETQLCDVLESLKSKASADPLREALIGHLEETRNQIGRIEKIGSLLGLQNEALFCVGMQGLIDEGWQAVDETPEGSAVRDAALIISMQRIEHYEMVSYGSLHALAEALEYRDVADLLEMNLAEERKADETLTRLAISLINPEALRESVEPAQDANDVLASSMADTLPDGRNGQAHITRSELP